MSYNEQLIEHVVETYCNETGNKEFTNEDLIAWAIQNKKWKPSLKSQAELLRAELSVALRAEKKKINKRSVRQYHCIRRKISEGYYQTVWAHIDVATEPFMEDSLGRRRSGIANVVFQYHTDATYWKKMHPESSIEAYCDFTNDNADKDHALDSGQSLEDDDQTDFEFNEPA